MLNLEVIDLNGGKYNLNVPENSKIDFVLSELNKTHNVEVSNSFLCFSGKVLKPTDKITQSFVKDSNKFALCNKSQFLDKSFSSVNGGFRFPASKYNDFFIDQSYFSDQSEDSFPQRILDLLRRSASNQNSELLQQIDNFIQREINREMDDDPQTPTDFAHMLFNLFRAAQNSYDNEINEYDHDDNARINNSDNSEEETEYNNGDDHHLELPLIFNDDMHEENYYEEDRFEPYVPMWDEPYNDIDNINFPGVELTPEDREVIRRISGYGYDPLNVVQVYFACNRDEETTLACLLSMS